MRHFESVSLLLSILLISIFSKSSPNDCSGIKKIERSEIQGSQFSLSESQLAPLFDFFNSGGEGDIYSVEVPNEKTSDFDKQLNGFYIRVKSMPSKLMDKSSTLWLEDPEALSRLKEIVTANTTFLTQNSKGMIAYVTRPDYPFFVLMNDCLNLNLESDKAFIVLTGEASADALLHEQVHLDDSRNSAFRKFVNWLYSQKMTEKEKEILYKFISEARAYTKQVDYLASQSRSSRKSERYLIENGSINKINSLTYFRNVSNLVDVFFQPKFMTPAMEVLNSLKLKDELLYHQLMPQMKKWLLETNFKLPDSL